VARIFVSYVGPDKPSVRRITTALRAAGHDPWLDEDGLLVGAPGLEFALRNAEFVILCLSKIARRGWSEAPSGAALRQRLRERKALILHARLDEVAPVYPFALRPHVDLFPDEQAFVQGMNRLVQTIETELTRRVNRDWTLQPERADSSSGHRAPDASEVRVLERANESAHRSPSSGEIRVFISYAHDTPAHASRVLALAQRLRGDGLDCMIDQFVLGGPPHGWAAWMEEMMRWTRFVLVVGSPVYLQRYELRENEGGQGAAWEGAILRRELYAQRTTNLRFLPLLFDAAPVATFLPEPLRDTTLHRLDADYVKLLRVLTNQPAVVATPIGRRPTLGASTLAITSTAPKPRSAARPVPAYLDAEIEMLSKRAEDLRARRDRLRASGIPAEDLDREYRDVRTQLRRGGQLRAGDFLGDGRYLLVRVLGDGGFGVVWEAHDHTDETRVAIKVLHANLAGDLQRRERFFRGAQAMMKLAHPGVVRVLEPKGEDGGYYYFVMELVRGDNLRKAVLAQRVQQDAIIPLILQIGEALAAAHSMGMIHRDVKPANILFDEHGNVKLTDFDLVGAFDTTGGTRTGTMGTVVYAAPECLHKPQDATARADVFGLGMTAIFCLSEQELTIDAYVSRAETLAQLNCTVSVRKVLERAVEWKPERRFADANEMVAELKKLGAEQTKSG
jgi:tRNA A-37 threonylcarbamoyl transferase component Bud32